MKLGRFAVSLAVKDIKRSRKFEDLGFETFDAHEEDPILIDQPDPNSKPTSVH